LREFDLKVKALSAVHVLVTKYKDTLLQENKAHKKLVCQMLGNSLQFLFNNDKAAEVQELNQIFLKASPRSHKEAKLHLLQSI
jgi:hypothetical protein